jgi:release factor glutamine methyltransferase
MHRLRDAIAEATAVLQRAGVDSPRLDARVLIAHVLAVETAKTFTLTDDELTAEQEIALEKLVARRAAREPVSRIIGTREFWGLNLIVTPDVLDPRADTEVLVSAAIDHAKRLRLAAPRILDLGAGTGCVTLALLSVIADSTAIAVDLSQNALHVARANARNLNLAQRISFARMSWGDGLVGPFDIIVSNPPYLSAHDMRTLSPEVTYDPHAALDGGEDGLACYRAILADVKRLASKPAILALEVGLAQAEPVARMAESAGLRVVEIRPDLAGIPRCVVAQN